MTFFVPEFHSVFSCCVFLGPSNLWQFLGLSSFTYLQMLVFCRMPSVWVYLTFSQAEIRVMHFGQDSHRSDVVSSQHIVPGSACYCCVCPRGVFLRHRLKEVSAGLLLHRVITSPVLINNYLGGDLSDHASVLFLLKLSPTNFRLSVGLACNNEYCGVLLESSISLIPPRFIRILLWGRAVPLPHLFWLVSYWFVTMWTRG